MGSNAKNGTVTDVPMKAILLIKNVSLRRMLFGTVKVNDAVHPDLLQNTDVMWPSQIRFRKILLF